MLVRRLGDGVGFLQVIGDDRRGDGPLGEGDPARPVDQMPPSPRSGLAGDSSLRREGRREERKGEAKEELSRYRHASGLAAALGGGAAAALLARSSRWKIAYFELI